jgi:hypothetical protein
LLRLTGEFNHVAEYLADLNRQLVVGPVRDIPFDVEKLPVLDLARWNGDLREKFNCLNFALDVQPETYGKMRPGDMYYASRDGQPGLQASFEKYRIMSNHSLFETFADYLLDNAVKDGLLPTGDEIRITQGGFPVALFLRSEADPYSVKYDFHWYALRQKTGDDGSVMPVWAHKPGRDIAVEAPGLAGIFKSAGDLYYQQFSGFYEVNPQALRVDALAGLRQPEIR